MSRTKSPNLWKAIGARSLQTGVALAIICSFLLLAALAGLGRDTLPALQRNWPWAAGSACLLLVILVLFRFRLLGDVSAPGVDNLDRQVYPMWIWLPRWLLGIFFRIIFQWAAYWQSWLILSVAVALCIRVPLLGWLHRALFPKMSGDIYLITTATNLCFAIFGIFIALGFVRSFNRGEPNRRLRQEIINQFRENAKKAIPGSDATVPMLWSRVASDDPGVISIMSINAYDLFGLHNGRAESEIAEALRKNPAKSFRVLLADPTAASLRRYNAVFFGRYCEYFAKRFVTALVVARQASLLEPGTPPRLEIRTFQSFPTYRLIMSYQRVIVQRYGWMRSARQQPAYLAYRMLSGVDLHAHECQIPSAPSGILPTLPVACRLAELKLTIHGDHRTHSVYSHFAKAFEDRWNDRHTMPEGFLDTWDLERLERFAKLCRVDDDCLASTGATKRGIAKAILARLQVHVDDSVYTT